MAEMTAGSVSTPTGTRTLSFVNLLGALMSLALLIGVAVWGYKLIVRDINGIPVVRAIQSEMRIAPETPGGEIAGNVGLAVNAVPAEGGAADPEDQLVLAPVQTALTQEDLVVSPATTADEGVVVDPEGDATLVAVRDPNAPLTAEDVLALADQIAAQTTTPVIEADDPTAALAVSEAASAPQFIPASVPGVSRSLRPNVRPAGLRIVPVAPVATSAQPAATAPVPAAQGEAVELTGALPSGTKLVQFGAFDSAQIAADEWVRISARRADLLEGKARVIQQAQSGGRTFFRLRAQGFTDLADARRFCAAFSADGSPCIPVVVR